MPPPGAARTLANNRCCYQPTSDVMQVIVQKARTTAGCRPPGSETVASCIKDVAGPGTDLRSEVLVRRLTKLAHIVSAAEDRT